MRRRTKRSILRYLPDAAPADGHTDEYLQHRHTASERDYIKVRAKPVRQGRLYHIFRRAVTHHPLEIEFPNVGKATKRIM